MNRGYKTSGCDSTLHAGSEPDEPGRCGSVCGAGCDGLRIRVAPATEARPEVRSYPADAHASADVDAALARARQSGKRVLLVMGANWCGDSRALAGWLATERFAELIQRKYELVFVDIGMPSRSNRLNLEIARRFGVPDLPGSPNVLVLTNEGTLVNATTATTWRNAESRTGDAIYEELASLADQPV